MRPFSFPRNVWEARAGGYSQLGNVYLVVVGVSGETREHSGQQMSAPALQTTDLIRLTTYEALTIAVVRGCAWRGAAAQARVGI